MSKRISFSRANNRARHRLIHILTHSSRNLGTRSTFSEGSWIKAVRGEVCVAFSTTLNVLLQQQVVRSRDMVVFVGFDTLLCVLEVKA